MFKLCRVYSYCCYILQSSPTNSAQITQQTRFLGEPIQNLLSSFTERYVDVIYDPASDPRDKLKKRVTSIVTWCIALDI